MVTKGIRNMLSACVLVQLVSHANVRGKVLECVLNGLGSGVRQKYGSDVLCSSSCHRILKGVIFVMYVCVRVIECA